MLGGEVICLSGKEAGKSPYDWDCGVIVRPSGVELCSFDEFDEAQAAAHAINQHDKLVAENERLSLVVFDLLKTKALRGGSNSAEAAIYAKHELLDLLNRT